MNQLNEILNDMYIVPTPEILCVALFDGEDEYIAEKYNASVTSVTAVNEAKQDKEYDAIICRGDVFSSKKEVFDECLAKRLKENGMLGIILPELNSGSCAVWFELLKNSGDNYSDAHFFRLCEAGIGITARGIKTE